MKAGMRNSDRRCERSDALQGGTIKAGVRNSERRCERSEAPKRGTISLNLLPEMHERIQHIADGADETRRGLIRMLMLDEADELLVRRDPAHALPPLIGVRRKRRLHR